MNVAKNHFEEQLLWITSFVNKPSTTDRDWKVYDNLLSQLGNFFKDKMFPDFKEKQMVAVLSPAIADNETQKHIYIS